MAHEKIYCDTADGSWHSSHPTDEVEAPDCQPGILIQWDGLGALGIATGDLLAEYGKGLPTIELADFFPEPRDSDTAAVYERLATAITESIQHAYDLGVAVPRMVWLDRPQANHTIRAVRRGRNAVHGADE